VSIHNRIAITVAAVIAVTVALFATLSIVVMDRALRSSFAARLRTTAQAVSTTADVHHHRLKVDASDLRELAALHEDTPFAIVRHDGTLVGGNPLPETPRAHGLFTVTVPVIRKGVDYGSVTVWQSDLWIGDFDRDAAIVSAAVGLLLIGIGVALSSRVAQSALAPAERIASLAETIEGHDLSERLHADGSDELGRLCASFDRMLDRLQDAFARERRFTADASHELRAPLAVLRAETELALRRPRSDQEYRAALQSIQRESARLEELVDELLAAARAGTDAAARQRVDAGTMLRQLSERVRPAAALRGIEIRTEAPDDAFFQGNQAMVERALLAIVHNAIAFANADGAVTLRAALDGARVRIETSDDGAGFSVDALTHATERFWRGDKARTRGGTGLGLAIARALIEANDGSLRLSNGETGGAHVCVLLPRDVHVGFM
jgi:signal transduction histidine kinase